MSDKPTPSEVNPDIQFAAEKFQELLTSGATVASDVMQELLLQIHYYGIALSVIALIELSFSVGLMYWVLNVFVKSLSELKTKKETEEALMAKGIISFGFAASSIFLFIDAFSNLFAGFKAMSAPILFLLEYLH